MVTNGRSVRSRSGSRGFGGRARRPPPRPRRELGRTPSSSWIRAIPSAQRLRRPRRRRRPDPDHAVARHEPDTNVRPVLILLPPSEGKSAPRARQAPRPRRPRLPGAHRRPRAGPRRPGRRCARGDPDRAADGPRPLAGPSATWSTCNAGLDRRRPRAPTGSTPASSTTRSASTPSPRPPSGGPAPGSRSPAACSAWCARATGSRRTGSPATPRCPASARWPASGASALGAGRQPRRSAPACWSTSGPARTPPSGGRRPSWRRRWPRSGCCTRSPAGAQVVSHFNKATKGRLVRALLEDGRDPRTPANSPRSSPTSAGRRARATPTGRAPGSTWSVSEV